MANFAFPVPRSIDPLRYFAPPSVVLPVVVFPAVGSASGNNNTLPLRNGAVHPAVRYRGVQSGSPLVLRMHYELFWKNKLHIIAGSFNALNVLSPLQNTFEIYNAGTKLPAVRLTSLVESGTTGIDIIDGTESAFTIGLQESEVYTYEIDSVGPSTIAALLTFTFSNGIILTHAISGRRIVVLNLPYQYPLSERWEWITDIIQAVDGTEQRNSMRDVPRQSWGLSYLFGSEYKNMVVENLLSHHIPDRIAVPIFIDKLLATTAITAGDTVIQTTATSGKDFRVGAELIIRPETFTTFETARIVAVNATSIEVESPLLQSFAVATEIYPIQIGRIDPEVTQTLYPINARVVNVLFNSEYNKEFSDEASFTTYKTHKVWEDDIILSGPTYQRRFEHDASRFDSKTGTFYDSSQRGFTKITSAFIMEIPNATEFFRIRNFLHARRGRQKMFWISTEREDFEIATDNAAGVILSVSNAGYTRFIFGSRENRSDIKITYANGVFEYREITGSVETSSTVETLTLNSASSQALSAANVARISYLIRARLAVEALEFVHQYAPRQGYVEVAITEVNG